MEMLLKSKTESLFQKRKVVFSVLFFLLFFQLFYSFIFPSSDFTGTGHGWLSLPELISHERSPLGSADISIINKLSSFFSKYTMVADGGVYILLAEDFPQYYFKDNLFLSRPLYSFLTAFIAFPSRLFFDSFAAVFASAIFLNFVLSLVTAFLLYSLIEKISSYRVAFLSSFLYIFSPIVHIEIIQPVPGIYGTFMVVAGLYLFYNYVKNPSLLKLVIFSLIAGVFLLGKLFGAVSIFVFLLAIYFKHFKEGILFLTIHLLPLAFWYLWVTQVFKLEFFDPSVGNFGSAVWLLDIFSWSLYKVIGVFVSVIPNFIMSLVYGFLLVPLVFAFFGFKEFALEKKEIICFSFILSFLILFFVANLYYPYYGFLMFPLVYPLTVLGIDRLAGFLGKRKKWYGATFCLAAYATILIVSNINIYEIYSNLINLGSRI